MAELGFDAGKEEVREERRRRNGGRFSSRWSSRRKGRARDGSADESTFYSSGHSSIYDGSFHDESYWFASAPGSFGGRRSFGSDLSALSPSPRSSVPVCSLSPPRFRVSHLAGCEPSMVPGLEPEPETRSSSPSTAVKLSLTKSNPPSSSKGCYICYSISTPFLSLDCPSKVNNICIFFVYAEKLLDIVKAEVHQQEGRTISPSVCPISQNPRDCQNQRVTFESLGDGHRRWRPGSLDLNAQDQNVAPSSLHSFYGGAAYIKSNCAPSMHSRSNMFPSPGTPSYWHGGAGAGSYQKGWCSERVPLPANRGQRYGDNVPLFPFNNGRTLPSKWEDAERWICSPVSGDGSRRPLMLPPYHRRPKSKSGPLGAPPLNCGSYASASRQIPCFDDGKVVNFMGGGSPYLAGVLVADQQLCGITAGGRNGLGFNGGEKVCTSNFEAHIDRSASMLGWLDTLVEPSTSSSPADGVFRGYRVDSTQEIDTMASPVNLSRDVGTQMSPEGSNRSSPKERHSSLSSPRYLYDKEEAKITAWENLQKAKAEASLQRLEMKLEKKRSSSMEKILNRLRSAQRKAQDMRSSVVDTQVCMIPRYSRASLLAATVFTVMATMSTSLVAEHLDWNFSVFRSCLDDIQINRCYYRLTHESMSGSPFLKQIASGSVWPDGGGREYEG
ncbi:hypothetical protein KSP40_PGU017256 [Platanthera guangdongensis]|uniref:Remorin C-terminal domain-containing protein n=1 Tax=Platanthera guangdongensis TaxID=2320717 RepID=A0ABR2MXW1_9ASPA